MLHKSTINRVLEVFFDEPTKTHYLKEISQKADLAHTVVIPALKTLCAKGLIKRRLEKRGSRIFPIFEANKDSQEFRNIKRLHNLERLESSKLPDYLQEILMPDCIVIFGSYARGEDIEDSDIDIYVQSEKKDISIKRFEKSLKRGIQLHFSRNFKDYPKELRNNIINGFVSRGYLEAL